jgi:gliding motility-associated-like protein
MKTLEFICLRYKAGFKCVRIFILYTILFSFPQLSVIQLVAQDIAIKNPSLEGALTAAAPSAWIRFEQSPDVQPGGCCGITQPASDGKTYVGALASAKWTERFAQRLETPLKAGKTYTISFDLAYPAQYYSRDICTGTFELYGANSLMEAGDMLWKSVTFKHTGWERYAAVFTPSKDYDYIVAGPYFDTACTLIYSGVLVDNLSPYIREVPQIIISAKNTCKDTSTGAAVVRVKNGTGPYVYSWQPGDYKDSTITNLRKGSYRVTVVSANGTSVTDDVQIGENDLEGKIIFSSPLCFGNNNAAIQLDVNGGISPYAFSIDKGETFQSSSSFNNLNAGTYGIVIKDAYNCTLNLSDLTIEEPAPLSVITAHAKPISCSDVQDGQIGFTATGGTRPYTYSIPGVVSQPDSIIRHLKEGEFHYRITDSHECMVEGDVEITKEWRDCAVFVPNAFSPNGDRVNDIFKARVQDDINDFRMVVYGRWGQLVFESRDPAQGWDGYQKGIVQPVGSYLWVITYTDSKKQLIKQQGTLLLVK